MKIAILSFKSSERKANIEEIRLKKAAMELGHKARIFRMDKCQLLYDPGKTQVLYDGDPFPHYDVIIPRLSVLHNVDLNVSIIKQFQLMKIPVVNGYLPATRAKNKLRTLQMLDHEGINVPKTVVIRDEKYIDAAIKQVGGVPVIIKTPFGSYGSGVVIAESKRAVNSAWDMIAKASANKMVLIQEYIKESKGKDMRVFVIGGKVIGAMQRQARKGEFRSNLELGGSSKAVEVSSEIKKMAIKSTRIMGLNVAGVDIIITKRGPAVMEVNCNPGFKGLEEATGLNVGGKIIEYAVKLAQK